MEYLVLLVTHHSVKPINRKIEAITKMKPYTYQKEVQQFIGVVNHYRNMWERLSHMLSPLTKIISS